jgi:RNA polymerase sigma-70 factor (ECF subfamily)
LVGLGAGGRERQAAERELHARLVRIALAEVRCQAAGTPVAGQELDDLAHQAAGDAMLAVLAKLADFRGESRFTTWAYWFVILEVSAKLGRHYWRHAPAALDAEQWEDAAGRYPGVAAHLLACGPCGEDFTGLLQAVTGG